MRMFWCCHPLRHEVIYSFSEYVLMRQIKVCLFFGSTDNQKICFRDLYTNLPASIVISLRNENVLVSPSTEARSYLLLFWVYEKLLTPSLSSFQHVLDTSIWYFHCSGHLCHNKNSSPSFCKR